MTEQETAAIIRARTRIGSLRRLAGWELAGALGASALGALADAPWLGIFLFTCALVTAGFAGWLEWETDRLVREMG